MNLKRMRYLLNRLPMARFRVERAMARATRTTARLTGLPRGSNLSDPVQEGAELLEEAREAYRDIQRELEALRGELKPLIAALEDPLERQAMELRYLQGLTARRIACALHYSERHIFRVLAAAEAKVEGATCQLRQSDLC